MKEILLIEIDPCGTDEKGNLRRWIGFDKTTDTIYGGKIIARLEPPSTPLPKTATKDSKI